jgi:hypothetical protein
MEHVVTKAQQHGYMHAAHKNHFLNEGEQPGNSIGVGERV